MICPHCQGNKGGMVIAEPGCRLLWMPCSYCRGTGEMSDRHAEWAKRGFACKQRRMAPIYRSLYEIKHLTGMLVVDISEMERGIVDPAPLEAALTAHGM